MSTTRPTRLSRRDLIRTAALAGIGIASGSTQASEEQATAPSGAVVVLAQLDFDTLEIMQAAMELARSVATETRKEDGCLHYAYGADVNVQTRLQLSEWWRDAAALDAHLHSTHLQEFRRGLRRLGGSSATVKRFAVASVADLKLPPLGA